MRRAYKMRTVTGETTVTPLKSKPDYHPKRLVLDCGHLIRPHTISSTADAIRVLAQEMSKKPIKERCYECARQEVAQ